MDMCFTVCDRRKRPSRLVSFFVPFLRSLRQMFSRELTRTFTLLYVIQIPELVEGMIGGAECKMEN